MRSASNFCKSFHFHLQRVFIYKNAFPTDRIQPKRKTKTVQFTARSNKQTNKRGAIYSGGILYSGKKIFLSLYKLMQLWFNSVTAALQNTRPGGSQTYRPSRREGGATCLRARDSDAGELYQNCTPSMQGEGFKALMKDVFLEILMLLITSNSTKLHSIKQRGSIETFLTRPPEAQLPRSHSAVLHPRLVYGRVRRAEGRGQRTQEPGQQREAQPAPGAEHGPAVAVADVLGQAVHVARKTGEFEVNAGHTGAEGDDAAGSWRGRKQRESLFLKQLHLLLPPSPSNSIYYPQSSPITSTDSVTVRPLASHQ